VRGTRGLVGRDIRPEAPEGGGLAIEPGPWLCYSFRYVKKKAAPKPKSKTTKTSRKSGHRAGPKATGKRPKATGKGLRPVKTPAEMPTMQRKTDAESLAAARAAMAAALSKKALVPVLIDVTGRASYADYIGIVSGRSDRQVDAIADGVNQAMRERGRRLVGREGTGNGRWALLDYGDVVVHVFYHPVREIFDIESLWIDAPRVKLQVPPEAMRID
jgi:ribosome-associated protein